MAFRRRSRSRRRRRSFSKRRPLRQRIGWRM